MICAKKHDHIKIRLETTRCVVFRLRSLTALLMTGFLLSFACPTFAIDLPDAGSILNEINQRQLPELPKQSPSIAPALQSKEYPNDVTTLVQKYEFMGNTLLDDEELIPLTKDFLERPVGVNDLHLLTAVIARYYREQGFLARVFLPKQAIDNGVVKIKIIEAHYSGIDLQTKSGTDVLRTRSELIEKLFGARQSKSAPLSLPNLERALLLAQDWPGLNLSASLKAGKEEGETGLLVMAENAPLLNGHVVLDNFGSKNTGAERFTGSVALNAPFGIGDRFRLQWLASEGTKYIRTEASMPIGYDGLRVSVDAAYLDYRVVNRTFSRLGLKGYSDNFGGSLSYPVIRANRHNLILVGRIEHKDYANGSENLSTQKYSINNFSVGFQGNYFDGLGLGGVTSAGLNVVVGDVNKNKSDPFEGSFSLWSYWLQRDQTLSSQLSASFSISGQRASKALDSAEQFSVGGATNLRAYPVNEGRGSDGDLLNLTLNWYPRLPCNCNFSVMFDYARVKPLDENSDQNSHYYRSLGVQANWFGTKGWSATASIARRLGNNPLPTSTGTDQDGSLKETRLWFSIRKSF